jgi:hypothetical protein
MSRYSDPPKTFEKMIAPYPAPIKETAKALRNLILSTLPQLDENVSGGLKLANALYSFNSPTQVLCGIQAGEKVCKMFVHHYDQLAGMGFKIEGSGRQARHIKFSTGQLETTKVKILLTKLWESSGY